MRQIPIRPVLIAVLCTLGLAGTAQAQSARKESGNNAQLMQQMQQLAAERTSLQAENARMKRELEETRKERDSLKGEREAGERRLRNAEGAAQRSAGDRQQLEADLAQQKERMTELVGKFRETVAALREVESERANTSRQLETRNTELKSCVDRNVQLYTLNDEILDKFESQGFWSSFAKSEPFTRIKRTQLENLADDYRARAQDGQLPAQGASVAVPPTAASQP
jgi:chromosome segregation ATPase